MIPNIRKCSNHLNITLTISYVAKMVKKEKENGKEKKGKRKVKKHKTKKFNSAANASTAHYTIVNHNDPQPIH